MEVCTALSADKTINNIKLFIEWNNGKCTKLSAISPIEQTVTFEINGEKIAVEFDEHNKSKNKKILV